MTVLDGLRGCARTLDPGYFALVMATGIVSIGMHLHGLTTVSAALLLVSAVAYAVLLALDRKSVV